MTATDTPETATPTMLDKVQAVLQAAADKPLTLKDVVKEASKGMPKPKKVKGSPAPDVAGEAKRLLEEEVRLGRAFAYESGKKGETRYWSKDEKHELREEALKLAAKPCDLAAFKKNLGAAVKGVDGGFVESVVRELIRDDELYEHPAAKKGKPLFGSTPPPPPVPVLEQAKNQKAVEKLAKECRKLMETAGVALEELFSALRGKMGGLAQAEVVSHVPAGPMSLDEPEAAAEAVAPAEGGQSNQELADAILKEASNSPVVSLDALRRDMPPEYRGKVFDATVLGLASKGLVILSQDADPARFTPVQRAEFVSAGDVLFTTLMKRS